MNSNWEIAVFDKLLFPYIYISKGEMDPKGPQNEVRRAESNGFRKPTSLI